MAGCGRGRVSPPTTAAGSGPGAQNTRPPPRLLSLYSHCRHRRAASVPRASSAPLNVPLPSCPYPSCWRWRCSRHRHRHRCSSCVHRRDVNNNNTIVRYYITFTTRTQRTRSPSSLQVSRLLRFFFFFIITLPRPDRRNNILIFNYFFFKFIFAPLRCFFLHESHVRTPLTRYR